MKKLNKKSEEKYMGALRAKKKYKGCPKSKTEEKKHEFIFNQHIKYHPALSAYYLKWYFRFKCRLCGKETDVRRLTRELSTFRLNRWWPKLEWSKQDLKIFDQCVKLPTDLNSPVDE